MRTTRKVEVEKHFLCCESCGDEVGEDTSIIEASYSIIVNDAYTPAPCSSCKQVVVACTKCKNKVLRMFARNERIAEIFKLGGQDGQV